VSESREIEPGSTILRGGAQMRAPVHASVDAATILAVKTIEDALDAVGALGVAGTSNRSSLFDKLRSLVELARPRCTALRWLATSEPDEFEPETMLPRAVEPLRIPTLLDLLTRSVTALPGAPAFAVNRCALI